MVDFEQYYYFRKDLLRKRLNHTRWPTKMYNRLEQDSPGEHTFLILRKWLPALDGDSAPHTLGL